MRPQTPTAKTHTGPNMTPMVDIVMCILIFFMLGSTFLAPELYLTNNMPAVPGGQSREPGTEPIPPVRVSIVVSRHGDATWVSAFGRQFRLAPATEASRKQDLTDLAAAFQDRHSQITGDVQYILAPHRNVPYADVISVYDSCIKANMPKVAFAPARSP